jgi:glutamate dehydrogenase
MGTAIRRGDLSLEQRNGLLHEVEQDVVQHVLYDNFLQAQILSQEAELSAARMETFEDLMQSLEGEGSLDRELEALPNGEEMTERRRVGRGLARPELAVLLAYAKQSLANALLRSSLPDSQYLEQDLRGYFPPLIVERFGHLLAEHPLRRELIATIVANDVVNSQGITFVTRLVAETGAEASDVVRAYRIARDVTGAVQRWESIEGLVGQLEPAVLDELLAGVDRLVELVSRWYLVNAPGQLGRAIDAARGPFQLLAEVLPTVVSGQWRHDRERVAWQLMDQGVPEETAMRHAFQPALVHGPSVIAVSTQTGLPIDDVARAFFLIGEAAYVDWLESRLGGVVTSDRWHRWALQAVEDDLLLVRGQMAERVLSESPGAPVEDAVAAFLDARAEAFSRLARFMRALALEEVSDLAAVTVAVRQIRSLAARP